MAENQHGAMYRVIVPNQHSRVTNAELLFDLVFVYALNQISLRLMDDFSAGRQFWAGEAGATLLLFLALWRLWVTNVAATSRLHPDSPPLQIVMLKRSSDGVATSRGDPRMLRSDPAGPRAHNGARDGRQVRGVALKKKPGTQLGRQ